MLSLDDALYIPSPIPKSLSRHQLRCKTLEYESSKYERVTFAKETLEKNKTVQTRYKINESWLPTLTNKKMLITSLPRDKDILLCKLISAVSICPHGWHILPVNDRRSTTAPSKHQKLLLNAQHPLHLGLTAA